MHLPFSLVLVTTDLSPLGDAALPVAFRLARDQGAKALVVSVIETPPAPSPLYAHYYPRPSQTEVDKQTQLLDGELKKRVTPEMAAGVQWETVTAQGEAAAEIARIARERGASLLVISTHGRTGLRHFFLGSVAERVLRQTSCPILLVR